jgi:pyridoxamine 5'-phosphate oxidase
LKGLDEEGAVIFPNYGSRKGQEIERNPFAAAVMLWNALQRQVRIEGPVTRLSMEDSDSYFNSRPRGSQLGAVSSPQSSVVAGRSELDARFDMTQRHFADRDVERPESWGGYRISFEALEFWQGRTNRMHDRLRYQRAPGGWSRERLAP